MSANKKIMFFVFVILLIGFMSFVASQEEENKAPRDAENFKLVSGSEEKFGDDGELLSGKYDIGENQGIGDLVDNSFGSGNIVASNIQFQKDKTGSTLTFDKLDGNVNLYGDKFENIKPQCTREVEKNYPEGTCADYSYIKLDEKGAITSADFTTNSSGGSYNINGTIVNVPANSRLRFMNGEIEIQVADNTELTKLPETSANKELPLITINGKNIKLPDGSILNKGNVEITKEGYVLDKDTEFIYKDLGIILDEEGFLIANKDVPKDYLDKHGGRYLQYTDDRLLIGGGIDSAVKIKVNKNSKFFGTTSEILEFNVPRGNYLDFKKDVNGKIELTHSSTNLNNNVEIFNGKNKLFISFDKVLLSRDYGLSSKSVPMTIKSDSAISSGIYDVKTYKTLDNILVKIDSENNINIPPISEFDGVSTDDIRKKAMEYKNSFVEPPQAQIPKQDAVTEKVKEIQNFLFENGKYLETNTGYCDGNKIDNKICQIDGDFGFKTNVALLASGVDSNKIKAGKDTVEYYDEILKNLIENEKNKIDISLASGQPTITHGIELSRTDDSVIIESELEKLHEKLETASKYVGTDAGVTDAIIKSDLDRFSDLSKIPIELMTPEQRRKYEELSGKFDDLWRKGLENKKKLIEEDLKNYEKLGELDNKLETAEEELKTAKKELKTASTYTSREKSRYEVLDNIPKEFRSVAEQGEYETLVRKLEQEKIIVQKATADVIEKSSKVDEIKKEIEVVKPVEITPKTDKTPVDLTLNELNNLGGSLIGVKADEKLLSKGGYFRYGSVTENKVVDLTYEPIRRNGLPPSLNAVSINTKYYGQISANYFKGSNNKIYLYSEITGLKEAVSVGGDIKNDGRTSGILFHVDKSKSKVRNEVYITL